VVYRIGVKSTSALFRCFLNLASIASRACVFALLVAGANGLAMAAQESIPNPCHLDTADVAGLNHDVSTDVHAERAYMATISHMLKEEKFEQLDCIADHARSGKERFSGGVWKIRIFYWSLNSPVQYPVTHATPEDWNSHLQRLQRWAAARPTSVTPRVTLAWAYFQYAWDARGNGFSNTVSDSGWKLLAERTAQAEQAIKEAWDLPTKDPEEYYLMQLVGQYESWSVPRLRAIYDEAIKFEPGYYYFSRQLAFDLLPKWFGQPGDTEKFIQETADRIGGDQGDIFYYQVASSSTVLCGGCEDDPQLSFERIERGYEASEKQYGVSMLNLNRIAYLAAYMKDNDAVFAQQILTRIGDQWDDETWKNKEEFETIRKWANQRAPEIVQWNTQEAAAKANLETPEGARYKAAFEKSFRELLQQCVRTDGSTVTDWQGKFEALTDVRANGYCETSTITWMGPVVMCAYRKMRVSNQQKSPMFPAPPKDSYWIRLDLDWTDFAPVAAK
jgi:hypothetical protein